MNKLTMIARAHQLAMAGYQWHFGEGKLVTVWSAPNYMYRAGNKASVMKLAKDLSFDFSVFEAVGEDHVIVDEEVSSYFA
jgi:hypothetical protein